MMNYCHNHAIKQSYKVNAALMFINSDLIFSNNCLKTICSYLVKGYRSICVGSLRLAKQNFINYLNKNFNDLNFNSRDLVSIALKFLHPSNKYLFWNSKKMKAYCTFMYWRLDSNNIILRGFHLHPLLIWPEKKVIFDSNVANIDGYFIKAACPSIDKIKVIQDSDELVLFELSDQNSDLFGKTQYRTITYLAWWAKTYADSYHWKFIDKIIYFKTNDHKETWEKIIKNSDEALLKIKNRIRDTFYNNLMIYLITIIKNKNFSFKNLLKKFTKALMILLKMPIILYKKFYILLYLIKRELKSFFLSKKKPKKN